MIDKIETLTLEQLAPYLPYSLGIKGNDGNTGIMVSEIGTASPAVTLGAVIRNHGFYKPILYPLSMLTQEIEHNGERFVPIEVLGKMYEPSGSFEEGFFGWDVATGGDDYQDYYYTIGIDKNNDPCFMIHCGDTDSKYSFVIQGEALPYSHLRILLKWHFDVFGLIDKGLAIDKSTI